jgi:hypothetical protein
VEGLGLAHSVDELESLATNVDDNAGVYFVPVPLHNTSDATSSRIFIVMMMLTSKN